MSELNNTNGTRIAKFLSSLNVCSRREAERLIAQGEVLVNGEVIKTPVCFVTERDVVCLGNRVVYGPRLHHDTKPKIWLYYKPRGEITTHRDPQGRRTVFASAREAGLGRVVSVGRLDINSEGLLLLTNSSAVAHKLEFSGDSEEKIIRVYKVRFFGDWCRAMNHAALKRYTEPQKARWTVVLSNVVIDGIIYAPIKIEFLSAPSQKTKNSWCFVTITEGKNREIRKVFEHLGLAVNRLIRVSYGDFSLNEMTPPLRPGEFREWTGKQSIA
ncbi:MAG: rRNA pseudouridine synthase [Holosporales bacterium]|nr:rRNA pseudouridine synthase [Holosporales bacterium]